MDRIEKGVVLLGWVLGLGAAATVLTTSTRPLIAGLGRATSGPDAALAAAAALAAWAVLAWLCLGVALTVLDTLTQSLTSRPAVSRLAEVLTPAVVGRGVRASLRAGLVAGAVGAAAVAPVAAQAAGQPAAAVRPVEPTPPTGWPVLDRPAFPVTLGRLTPATVVPTPRSDSPGSRHYRVRPGDSLWSIAAAHLPAGASPADIAGAWPRWWQANRTIVGDDPGLIRPGQLLRVPGAAS